MAEIICVDGKFPQEWLQIYKKYGVITPKEDSLYSIREVINHSNGQVGILLEEIINPEIPVQHSILGMIKREPTWKISRFRNLDKTEITKEQLKEVYETIGNR